MSKDSRAGFHVLIPAAGTGARTGLAVPKQYRVIGGKMILRHTIEKFLGIQGLKSLRVIIDPRHADLYHEAVQGLDLPPPVHGADTRKRSVYNGLSAFSKKEDEDIILIHDAARPFVSADSVCTVVAAMETAQAATLVSPVADTLVDPDYNRLDRDRISSVQTPQAFRIGALKTAHEKFEYDNSFTDDAGLIAAMGGKITLVPGSHENFKITSAGDMAMAEKLLAGATETRTGFGYDVHAFDPAPASFIRLGGIDIPHDRKLLGHSDADVLLHALTDALLGTIGEGDIGQLFPPSDMRWKNADSEIFVAEAVRRVHARGGKIIHADLTLIAEAPKIGPHREKMIVRIASMLSLTPDRIGLKATTSEGLGFTGRSEGLVAQAVASITLPV
ncbi:MAG TPA: bifunctional 2-C-methyl-D-erythritol 4-phosphate cytidylyltransferase/2-C-methyl-D-erythritol 2,4-cyclodiphosphate synthase [Micavibrio sp.]|nr:bifunctional 2-C-methyl-D-erythritol 4-phosphate cytidylyltransferase/2-C-methyl-D-erythritol 2,4-cyclodiphosphate synthase [Micavibrio sp.]